MGVPSKKKINSVIAELKRHQKDLATRRDRLRELRMTIEELEADTDDASNDLEDAIQKLSRLQ